MADDAINNMKNALIVQLNQQQESPEAIKLIEQSQVIPDLDENNSKHIIFISSNAGENTEIINFDKKLNLNEIDLDLDEDEEEQSCSALEQEPQNNVDIHLETPQAETAGNSGKQKRISDEFFSADDGDDLDEEEECDKPTASCSTNSSKTNSDNRINEFDDDGNVSEPAYISEETSSCSSLCYQNSQKNYFVQYDELNAIEREDFEEEQKLTGQLILKNSSLIHNSSSSSSSSSNQRLNLGILNKINLTKRSGTEINQDNSDEISENHMDVVHEMEEPEETETDAVDVQINNDLDDHLMENDDERTEPSASLREQKLTTTPTSSRSCNSKLKSTINKSLKLSLNLEKIVNAKQNENEEDLVNFTGKFFKILFQIDQILTENLFCF